ncbi:hypothetical protein BU17DRAFT_62691 [Hysterangium stoloniferum]|nr:hypothetical protein BU17DRAFT_62691 [Hysterangium stoloniferum]
MERLPHFSTAFHPAPHPATTKSRRNAAAPLGAVGPSVTAQSSFPATFAHTLANSSRFVEILPVLERRGRRRIIAVSNGVFVDAIDRSGKRNDKRSIKLDLSPDLGSRDRLGGCIGFLSSMDECTSWPATRTVEWTPDNVAKVPSELFGGGIRAYAFTGYIHEREARHHSFRA